MNYGMAKVGIHSVTASREYLDEVSKRLTRVHIECCSFEKCIRMYDSPDTFLYMDPPYPDTAGGKGNYDLLSMEEWASMRELLGKIKGKFLLSCNDIPFVVKIFKGYHLRRITVRVTLAKNNSAERRKEILVSNYPLPQLRRHAPIYLPNAAAISDARKRSVQKRRKEFAR